MYQLSGKNNFFDSTHSCRINEEKQITLKIIHDKKRRGMIGMDGMK